MMPNIAKSKKVIYLDHAATTPLDPRVKKVMEPFWTDAFGNPSSLYGTGQQAARAIVQARTAIAQVIESRPGEVIFTAGGTESINLAIFGVARQYEAVNKRKGHIITSAIEHHSVLRSYEALEREGWKSSYVKVDGEGFIKLEELQRAIRPDTVLISVMYANNEIGTIQPITEIGKWLKSLNVVRAKNKLPRIVFHTDACQAAGALGLNVHKLGVDLLTANGSKIYGPKQTGFLYVRQDVKLKPIIYGGGQEKNLRSGTENVPGVIGLAEALRSAQDGAHKENARLAQLRDYFTNRILKKIPNIIVNGPAGGKRRLPNNINISIIGVEGEALLLYLDSYNICASTGSACSTTNPGPSHVIMAIGGSAERANSAVRFTLGRQSNKKEINYIMEVLPKIVAELRRMN